MSTSPRALVGVDVGGTFTDLAFFDEETGEFRIAKAPSNRGDEAPGFIEGLKRLGPISNLGAIIHGTTVGTNALLERKGVAFREVDAPHGSAARKEAIARSGGRMTVPQIFINGRAVGGSDDLAALERAGRLDALLAEATPG